ncbi:MAG: helix-turn-helix domain-containing protein [Nanoarchaeota archaeon]|nr:helix-turn-helix domain-containing protein [Nanoarchaeota archaeon]MBU1030343.1 helix-turn-helix domain-containing protein [Nanoarchaeota archaeon]MBU1849803.1 helix-turn-helix domain-containing protein [Nanoarchaeota archaeon]
MINYLKNKVKLLFMAKKREAFLLVSLSEEKTKHLAQIVSNETARKILDFLTEKDATETEIAKELEIPISTVHYNLQQLVKGKLVIVEEFHYSEKGKEVNHYKLANKYIIIAPKSTWGLREKLRKILPVAGLTLGISAIIQIINMFFKSAGSFAADFAPASKMLGTNAASMAEEAAINTIAARSADTVVQTISTQTPLWQHAALWFLIGGFAAILIYLLIDWIKEK